MDFGVIILAIVQGIAEFLPISSSAHLIIFRDVFNIGTSISSDIALSFDIALHFGTLLAILVVFFKDFWNILLNTFTKDKTKKTNLLWGMIVATIPAALAAFLFEDIIDGIIRGNLLIISAALIFMGVILYLSDSKNKEEKELKDITLKDSLFIGISQTFALIPGFSRSGTTISMARFLKLKRADAAKFSFYLSAPVVLGATLLQLLKEETIPLIISNQAIFFTGVFVSFIVGIFCIKFLLNYLKKNDFKIFMYYRVLLGIIVIIKVLIG